MSVTFNYQGTDVLVTGGTSGIGHAIAGDYLAAGAHVHITGTRAGAEDYDIDLSGFQYHQLDMEDNDSVDALAARLSKLDILVNNAGVSLYALGLDEHDPDTFMRAVNMHLVSGYRLAHGVVDKIADSKLEGGGSIVGIASATSVMGLDVTLGYGAAKTGLLGLVRGMAVDLGKRNIRVNAVGAGLTRTGMTEAVFTQEEWMQPTLMRTPLGRLGEPKDISGAVLFMTSPAAAWITGQLLLADGGYTIHG
ncbi:MAG: SDR family NAD(P)-dependent oxidoreductase [Parvibaculales bacterium]